ncbi:MAG: hypothetical protein OXI95_05145 [bacterium]|nr:hypothetical protein [bacterium]MDE0416308.1 hypothetical protein [bacterium]
MEAELSLSYWLFQPELWVILGIILIVVDIMVGFGLIVLPVGVAALLVGVALYGDSRQLFGDANLFTSWCMILILFAVLSIVALGLIRLAFQRSKSDGDDINRY